MKYLFLIWLVLWALLGVARAGDEPETEVGKRWFATGSAAFQRGDYAAAADAFKQGFDSEPWSGFLFAWAQAERTGGSCAAAIELYSRFIATDPPKQARSHAIRWIEVCGGTYEPPKAPLEATPQKPVPAPPPPPPPPPPDPGFQHKLAITLGVASVASGVVALRFYTWSRRDAETSLRVSPYSETARVYDRARSRLTIARVSAGVAAGFAIGAILRAVLHRDDERVEIAVSATGVLVGGAF